MRKRAQASEMTPWFEAIDGIELQHGRNVDATFAPHFHEEYQILVLIDGALRLAVGACENVLRAPTICVIAPGLVHSGRAEGWGWECCNYYVSQATARKLSGARPSFSQHIVDDPELSRRLLEAYKLARAVGSSRALITLHGALGELFHKHGVCTLTAESAAHHPGVDRVLRHLRARHAERLPVEVLADIAGLSPFHFLRVFAQSTGLTPHAYQNQLRVAHAKRLLREDAPAAQAASEAGFCDQSHLIRALLRSHGITPAMFKRTAAGSNFIQ